MFIERLFKALDVLIAAFAPTIGSGIGGVANLQLGDGGFGVVDAVHGSASLSRSVTMTCLARAKSPAFLNDGQQQ